LPLKEASAAWELGAPPADEVQRRRLELGHVVR
jgi:hypothetical protein